jgi:5'-deoxy-5'-methylthioadenosine phosphorylase
MGRIAIIAGTGFRELNIPDAAEAIEAGTPFGQPSGPILRWMNLGHEILFLPRHGLDGSVPPHKVNYRANVWAIHQAQAEYVLAVNTVGGIASDAQPGMLVIPDQLVDYTWGRPQTFFDGDKDTLTHIEFTLPYCESFRRRLIELAEELKLQFLATGTHAVTQGPRLETAAEVNRLSRDGCDVVGMTGMPEAALARELELRYACCAVVVNRAAGIGDISVHAEIDRYLNQGMEQVSRLVGGFLEKF